MAGKKAGKTAPKAAQSCPRSGKFKSPRSKKPAAQARRGMLPEGGGAPRLERPAGLRPEVFDPRARRLRFTDAQLIAILKRFMATHPEPYTMPRFMAWPQRPCSAATLAKRFGSYRHALAAAGHLGGKCLRCTPADLIELLEAAWMKLGRPPGRVTLPMVARVTHAPYEKYWGSLAAAREALGRYHAGEITRRQLENPKPGLGRRPIAARLRWHILKRDGYRCRACGASPQTDAAVKLQVDHIVPRSRGGGTDPANLRTLCAACNGGKGDEGGKEDAPARGAA